MTSADVAGRVHQDQLQELERLEALAWHLDAGFRIPGTPIRFGWDSLLGLIPGIGDTGTALIALYFPFKALLMGAGIPTVAHMTMNVAVDWLIGLIPVFGDLFDVGFRCNQRNVRLLRKAMNAD